MSGTQALSASQALPLISRYESGGKNVLNGFGPGYTASGYYQIVNGTWQQYAPKAGVDLSQYPTAMSAPQDVQTQVATQIYNAQGIGPWKSNAPLMSAINAGGTGGNVSDGGASQQDIALSGGGMAPYDPGIAPQMGGATTSLPPTVAAKTLQGYLAAPTEYLLRGSILFIGAGLVFICLIAMLWQSKTVQVSVGSIAKGAVVAAA